MPDGELGHYRLSPAAQADLEEIWLYSAETWSEDQAERYMDLLEEAFERLRAMPGIARERQEFTPPVRIHPAASHLIIYRIENDHLAILRILGGRQDCQAVLGKVDG